MRLAIVTAERVVVDTDASELTAPGMVGEFGVLPQHVTFLGGLGTGVLTYLSDGRGHKLVVTGGYAEVREDTVTILADEATPAEDIDEAQARRELDEARRAVEAGSEDPETIDTLLASLQRAEAAVRALS